MDFFTDSHFFACRLWPRLSLLYRRRLALKKDLFIAIVLWVIVSIVLELAIIPFQPFPSPASQESTVVDSAFKEMMYFSAPVFAFVVVMVIYSMLRFRQRGDPTEDGPATHGSRSLIFSWLAITTALCLLVIVTPGITGLRELRAHANEPPDLLVQMHAGRFYWQVTYPAYGISTFNKELVLPKDELVRFEVTSGDTLHSFWIPAFRTKIDAVPGKITLIDAVPSVIGDYGGDFEYRVQCAELCGLGHNGMRIPVRVLSQADFQAWVAENAKK